MTLHYDIIPLERVVACMGDDTMTKEEMIQQLLDELERNMIMLDSDDPKRLLECRQRIIKSQLESFGVNTESLTLT